MKQEYQHVLNSQSKFKFLENSVSDLSAMLISKTSKELTLQQKNVLHALFGDSTVLHTLRLELVKSQKQN